MPIPTFVVALLAVMAASTLWSYSRAETVRDVLTFVVIALAAIVLVQIVSLNSLAIGVALSGVILLIWCGILIVSGAESAFTVAGDLLGPYGNRNGLAYALLQSVPAALAMRLRVRLGFVLKWLIVIALAAGIVATGSKTSLLVLAVVITVGVGFLLLRWRRTYGFIWAVCVALVVVVAALNFESLLGILGKSDTISGRIPMWAALVPLVAMRPLTGYGWSLSLPVGAPPSVAIQESVNGIVLYHAHNEVMNWLVTTGALGALLILAIYGLVLWAGLEIVRHTDLVAAAWISLGGLVLLLRGLSEISETLPQGWFVLVILVAASVKYLPSATAHPISKWIALCIPFTAQAHSGTSETACPVPSENRRAVVPQDAPTRHLD
ncbi:O-antigen ligase [Cryobacterium sp. Y50]|uniref:O-antigen ligase family protein n=1 Tax=Cryobacterium sp. Y50 TaxID=2048286 RepID=UPI001304D8D8|nr:O-antigen ligase family protein [Cryobacterium sp. Y50]